MQLAIRLPYVGPADPVFKSPHVLPFTGKVTVLPYLGKPATPPELVTFSEDEIAMHEVSEDYIDPLGDPYLVFTLKVTHLARLLKCSEHKAENLILDRIGKTDGQENPGNCRDRASAHGCNKTDIGTHGRCLPNAGQEAKELDQPTTKPTPGPSNWC